MRLAMEPTLISHGGNTVRLRPSLRAAYILERKHGIRQLYRGVSTGHAGIILDILNNTADDTEAAIRVFDHLIANEGVVSLQKLTDPLYSILSASYGIDSDSEHPVDRKSRPYQPFDMERALVDLFEIGTGWLEWTPTDTWNATPAEIVGAQRGLIAKLRAIHGGNSEGDDQPSYDPRDELSPEELQTSIAKLRSIAAQGGSR